MKLFCSFLLIQCVYTSLSFAATTPLYELLPNFPKNDRGGKSAPIINGMDTRRGDFPWQVLILMDGKSFCGGSIISTEWILTAAHCLEKYSSFKITLGATNLSSFEDTVVIEHTSNKIVHPKYNKTMIENDIGLIKLPLKLSSTLAYAKPIRLPAMKTIGEMFVNQSVTTSGWGRTSDDASSGATSLQTTQLQVISNSDCKKTFPNNNFNLTLCCTGIGNKSICNGDSGSALVYKESDGLWTQIGISSFVSSRGCTVGKPSAFTRVTNYLSWIALNTGIKIR